MKIYNKIGILFFVIIFSHNNIIAFELKNVKPQQSRSFTAQNALVYIRKIIEKFPSDNVAAAQVYEKNESFSLTKCAYVLYNSARMQILETLREIDNRKSYWLYQKDHQWQYFLSKNPLKWITGQNQEVEIQNNLDMLESHQGELYVLLGQLLEKGNIFTQGYKTSFLVDYNKAYEWIDELLNLLSRIKVPSYNTDESSPFMARVMLLKMKLEGVGYFKNDLLSDIKETQVPSKFEQNWLKYGTLGLVLGYGYNAGGVEKIKNSFDYIAGQAKDYVVTPVKKLAEEVFVGEKIKETDKKIKPSPEVRVEPAKEAGIDKNKKKVDEILKLLPTTQEVTLKLVKQYVDNMTKKYGIGDAEKIKTAMEQGDYGEFQKLVSDIKNADTWTWLHPVGSAELLVSAPLDYGYGEILFGKLFGFESIKDILKFLLDYLGEKEKDALNLVEENKQLALNIFEENKQLALDEFAKQQRQFAGVSKLVLLTPAVLTALLGYIGYQTVTTKNYGPIRRALVDINSLFVDQSKPLDDERYGKMVYLVYNLKKLAEKELPQKSNIRADFLQDLDNVESKEFDIAAKRRIIDDMFRKYSFLGSI